MRAEKDAAPAGARGWRGRFSGPRLFAGALTAAMAIILFLSMPAGAGLLFRMLQIYQLVEPARLESLVDGEPSAIVILAAGRRILAPEFGGTGRQTVDSVTLERLRYGAFVARLTHLPILVSGGLGPIPLATLMADALMTDYGLEAEWREALSRNTAENAIYSARMLNGMGIHRVLLVTHSWHMRRAVRAFQANGMKVIPLPTASVLARQEIAVRDFAPAIGTLHMSGYAIHELLGLIWYKLQYGY